MTSVRQCRRFPAPFALFLGLALVGAAGCSNNSPVPECANCDAWTQITAGLGRYPDTSPADPHWIAYSTIEKKPNAPDANRVSDEDIWMTYLADDGNAADDPKYQLTNDSIGTSGDNVNPRFSPSGGQLAFVHSTPGGHLEIWRMPVTLPADPSSAPVVGVPEIVVTDARDPAWETETRLYFIRGGKIYRVDLPSGAGPPINAPLQLTFDPPQFASTEVFTDRHPAFSPDGGGVFIAAGRRNTADIVMKAYEIDDTVYPPDTTEARAWVSYQSPTAQAPTYPLLFGPDTLKTPALIRSVPVGSGGTFTMGARRDSRYLAPTLESYCDTLITIPDDLRPGDVDTLAYYFRVVRGTLKIASGVGLVNTSWIRAQDQREGKNATIANPGGSLTYPCLMPYAVQNGQIDPTRRETFFVRGVRAPLADSAEVVINPGKTTTVALFPTTSITATVTFEGNPSPLPIVQVTAAVSGTSTVFSSGNADATTGDITLKNVPRATWDVTFTAPGSGYRDTTITGVVVIPPTTAALDTVMMSLGPAPSPGDAEREAVIRAASAGPATDVVVPSSAPADNPADLAEMFRADATATTVWRLEEDPFGRVRLQISQIPLSDDSSFLVQDPVVTDDLGNGLRYLAYVSNETGEWQLYVQRLQDWVADGASKVVETPGSNDNLSCVRTVFHPRWVRGRGAGQLALIVTLGDCPSNGFEELGTDDSPWAVGEIRIWQVELGPGF